jgi:hypothetical protein
VGAIPESNVSELLKTEKFASWLRTHGLPSPCSEMITASQEIEAE